MNPFKLLVDFHNWLSDKDFIWWPFSFLRPPKHEPITMRLVSLMTACFGGLAFLMFTTFAVVNNLFTLDSSVMTLVSCFGGFFLWFSLITKPVWNIRARALAKKK